MARRAAAGVATLATGVEDLAAGVVAFAGEATVAGVATLEGAVLGDAARGVAALGEADRESTCIGEADREADAGTFGEADRGVVALGAATGLGVGAAARAAMASGVIFGVAGVPFLFDALDATDTGVDGASGVVCTGVLMRRRGLADGEVVGDGTANVGVAVAAGKDDRLPFLLADEEGDDATMAPAAATAPET